MIQVIRNFIINLNQEMLMNLIIAVIIIAVLDIFSPLFSYIIIKIFNWKSKGKTIRENAFYIPLKSFFKVLGIYSAIIFLKPVLNINDEVMNIVTKIFKLVVIVSTAVGLSKSITKKSRFIRVIKEKSDKDVDEATTKFIVRIIRAIIYIIAGFMITADLGYDLSGLITGLGLGSVVVTLAAQDTIKNLFGGLVIFLDKPFKIGDYIKFGEYAGTVEDINFRSTKVRTIETTVAQIPNSEMVSDTVINYGKINKRRYDVTLSIVLDTNLNKIEKLKTDILEYLKNNQNVIEETANVFFKEIASSSYDIQIYCYINVTDYVEFLKIKEQLNYAIMEIVNNNGIDLAYETKTVIVKK